MKQMIKVGVSFEIICCSREVWASKKQSGEGRGNGFIKEPEGKGYWEEREENVKNLYQRVAGATLRGGKRNSLDTEKNSTRFSARASGPCLWFCPLISCVCDLGK